MTHTIFQRDITSRCRAAFGRGLPTATLAAASTLVPILIILFCLIKPPPLHAQARFTGLGFFGGYESRATDVSADGRVVVGFSEPNMFRWTRDGGLVRPAIQQGRPSVSADGSVVTGIVLTPENAFEAFRWVVGESFTPLGDFAGGYSYPISRAFDVSADGRTVVGHGDTAAGDMAFRWAPQTGMVALGDLNGGDTASRAHGVSADGSVIVGYGTGAANFPQAVRWTAQTGLRALSSARSQATAVSADGRVIVGFFGSGLVTQAFRWTADGGMVSLGDLPGGLFNSIAHDLSADGSVIVGSSDTLREDGNNTRSAFYWTADMGMVNLQDLLIRHGVTNLDGWRLSEARAVTPNGLTVVGTGVHDGRIEAFTATVPEPSTILLAASVAVLLLLIGGRGVKER